MIRGFRTKPYNCCVKNKIINVKKIAIGFYVDYDKISHKYPKVVTAIIDLIRENFGTLTVYKG